MRSDSRNQAALFPVSFDESVPQDHVCRSLMPLLNRSTLSGYLQQGRSSRRLERECQRNVELMWLLNRLSPFASLFR